MLGLHKKKNKLDLVNPALNDGSLSLEDVNNQRIIIKPLREKKRAKCFSQHPIIFIPM